MELFGVDILKILTIDLVHVITIGVLGGVLLHYATGYFYFLNRSYKKVITVMIVGCGLFFIFDLIPVFGVGLGHLGFSFLIKFVYNESWAQALGAWFLSIFMAFMVSLLILLVFDIEIIFMPNLLS